MSAEDNELDYLHVPRGPVDSAITDIEVLLKKNSVNFDDVMNAVVRALRELQYHKGEVGRTWRVVSRNMASSFLSWYDRRILRLDDPPGSLWLDMAWFFFVVIPVTAVLLPLLLLAALINEL